MPRSVVNLHRQPSPREDNTVGSRSPTGVLGCVDVTEVVLSCGMPPVAKHASTGHYGRDVVAYRPGDGYEVIA